MRLRGTPIVSSLPLQRLLHLNVYYSWAYAAAEVGLTVYKLAFLSLDVKVRYSLPILVAVWCICELARLPLGYTGNLREKVSELSAFWLLSLFPQLPLVVYLTVGQMKVGGFLPLDLAAGILLMGIVVAQLWHGYAAIGAFIRKQTADFTRLCQEDLLASLAEQEGAAFAGAGTAALTLQQQQQALYGASTLRQGAGSQQPVPPELPSMAQVAAGGARHLAAAASAVLFAQSAASAAAAAPAGRPPLYRRGGTSGGGAEGGTGIELPMASTQRLGGRGGQTHGAGHEKVG